MKYDFVLDGKYMQELSRKSRYALLQSNAGLYYIYELFSWGYGYCVDTFVSSDVALYALEYNEIYN